jgi:formate dehydrogenase maturation protein FdhE
MNEELKPCPFCGGKPTQMKFSDISDEDGVRFYWWSIGCISRECYFNPIYEDFDTEADAIKAWNHRPLSQGGTK